MKKIPLAVFAMLLMAAPLGADEAQKQPPREPTMAERAAAARAKRSKSNAKVITNEDVRRSKGKLAETTGTQAPLEPAPTQSTTERHEADKKAHAVASARLAAAREVVSDLERQLLTIEQSYYEESDLDRRDGELVRRFDDVSRQLDEARRKLQALDGATPIP